MKRVLMFGVPLLLLITIPVAVFFMKQQQDIRGRAAPASVISFSPSTVAKKQGDSFTLNVQITTGANTISAAELVVNSDPTKVKITGITAGTFLANVLTPGAATPGKATITLGSPPTSPKQGTGTLATVTFQVVAASGTAQITFAGSKAAGISEQTNVISQMGTATVTIGSVATGGSTTVTKTPAPTRNLSFTPTRTPTPTKKSTQTGGGDDDDDDDDDDRKTSTTKTPTPTKNLLFTPTKTPTPTTGSVGMGGAGASPTNTPTPTTAEETNGFSDETEAPLPTDEFAGLGESEVPAPTTEQSFQAESSLPTPTAYLAMGGALPGATTYIAPQQAGIGGAAYNPVITSPAEGATLTTTTPTFTGTASSGGTVTITIYSEPVTAVVTADASGYWTYTVATPLAEGQHQIVVSSLATDGTTGTASRSFYIVTDGALPVSGANPIVLYFPIGIALLFILVGLAL